MFPKRAVMPDGTVYAITFDDLKRDWAETVQQFDDLTDAEKAAQVAAFDVPQAQEWYMGQWDGLDIVRLCLPTGEIDGAVRDAALARLRNASGLASEYEQEPRP